MKRPSPTGGYSLPELLVSATILGSIAAVGGSSLYNLARRERANAVASELAGWLDMVNHDARRANTPLDGATCTVTVSTGNLAAGDQLAAVTPAVCAQQNTLTVPDLANTSPMVNVTATPATFEFSPRGTVATDEGGDVLIRILVNNAKEVRCVRLTWLIGVLEVGRNNEGGACNQWSRV